MDLLGEHDGGLEDAIVEGRMEEFVEAKFAPAPWAQKAFRYAKQRMTDGARTLVSKRRQSIRPITIARIIEIGTLSSQRNDIDATTCKDYLATSSGRASALAECREMREGNPHSMTISPPPALSLYFSPAGDLERVPALAETANGSSQSSAVQRSRPKRLRGSGQNARGGFKQNARPTRAILDSHTANAYLHFMMAHEYEEMATTFGRSEYATRAIEEYKMALNYDPASNTLSAIWPSCISARGESGKRCSPRRIG